MIDAVKDGAKRARAARASGDHNTAARVWHKLAEDAQAVGLGRTASHLRVEWANDIRAASAAAAGPVRTGMKV